MTLQHHGEIGVAQRAGKISYAGDALARASEFTNVRVVEGHGHARSASASAMGMAGVLLRKKSTTETQAIMIRFAMVIGACEQHWDLKYTENADSSWRAPSADTCFYFELVAALGHELSPVEQLINDPGADADRWPHLSPTSGLGSDDHDGDESEASESDDEPDNDVDVIDDPADNAAHDAEAQVG